jgi:cell division protein FtsW (lipid II flippase)
MRPGWRGVELGLLPYPAALLLLGLAWLTANRDGRVDLTGLAAGAYFTLLLLAGHLWLCWRLPRSDQMLFPIAAGLVALGQLMITRLLPDLALRQAMWVTVGLVAMVAAASLLPSVIWLKRYRYSLAAFGLVLVLVTMVLGVDPNNSGARLWLGFGGLYFQPSELLKVLLVVFFAAYLDEYRELLAHGGPRIGPFRLPPVPYLAPLLIMFGISQAVLFWQRDLGAALLFFGIFLSMLYVASGRASYALLGAVLFLAGAFLSHLLFSHVRLRVAIWIDPWSQADSGGYQLVQALMALGSGGVLGSGLGLGYPEYIPAVHTDFIIAAIGEELGLAGSLATVAMYMLFVERGLRAALNSVDSFGALLGAGLTAVFGIQALVILGGTLRLTPLTGITLPLVSYGGSSILANFILLGLLLRVSAEREELAYAS